MQTANPAQIVIAEGKVRTYNMSGRRYDTDSPWRGRQRFHTRRGQSRRRLREFVNRKDKRGPFLPFS